MTTFLRSAFGLLSPARVCFLRRSSLTRCASNIVRLVCEALWTGFGMWRVLRHYRKPGMNADRAENTYREILPTALSNFHRSLRLSRYSIAARSRVSMIPSFSDARAFHIRRLPSSEPDSTKRASAVKSVDATLLQCKRKALRGTVVGPTAACVLCGTPLVGCQRLPSISARFDPSLR